MLKNYLKTALRYLQRNKAHSFINIAGLSVGMAVAILIGLWIWDELSFDKYHKNYDSIAEVMEHKTLNGTIATSRVIPVPLETALRKTYGANFKRLAMTSHVATHILTVGDKVLTYPGVFMGQEGPAMFTLEMEKGNYEGLKDPSSILLSRTVAEAIFGSADPMAKLIKVDNDASFKVTGVYKDIPKNSNLCEYTFIMPWDFYASRQLAPRTLTDWSDNSWFLYVQMADKADIIKVSDKIKKVNLDNVSKDDAKFQPEIFLQPMSKWHLYGKFVNGVNTGGAIEYVWLFGIIGVFVLLLACINFMNLSTARSEKRAKEVGIRKAVGSVRSQLITQFFCESLLVALFAFFFSIILVQIALPFFNHVSDKKIEILWDSPFFWLITLSFTAFTGLIAGSYPAIYLSSFNPVNVLKGVFKAGRLAAIPRQVLVLVQFTVSVILIIGTIVVFKQIQFTKNRPVGYDRNGLVNIATVTDDLHNHFEAVRSDLLSSGLITEAAESSSPATGVNNNRPDVSWPGKDPSMTTDFANIRVTMSYGKSVGWQFVQGRDFNSQLRTDSSAIVLNEAAVKYMGLKDPIGQVVKFGRRDHQVIGVIKDMVMSSPYDPVKQTIFYSTNDDFGYINIRIDPTANAHKALDKIKEVCKTYSPAVPFIYKFADEEYALKFSNEDRIGKLATFFATLAVFISCLGLFGMASFMAEQRVKEIGVRKVLGASVVSLWVQLSKGFIKLVAVSLLISIPLSYYFMGNWLQHFQYRSDIPWWIFAFTALGALMITLMTVSYQAIRAALMNPVKSLRSE